jgi:autotransporter-associated beta strand protein
MKKSFALLPVAITAAVFAALSSTSSAQTKIYTGATSGTFGTASNFVFPNGNPASAPGNNEDVIFTSEAANKDITLAAAAIFRRGYLYGGDYTVATNGQSLTLQGGLVNFSPGSFTVNGDTTLSGGLALTGTGTGTITFNGAITGPVATGAFSKTSTGALNLKGAYTNASTLAFTGGVTTLSDNGSFNQTGAVTIGFPGGSGQQSEGSIQDATGAALVLDNTSVNNENRIASTFTNASNVTTVLAVNFTQGGLLHLKGNAAGTNEVLGGLVVNGSAIRLRVDTAAPSSTAQLTFASLSNGGLVQYLSNNTLGGNSKVVFTTAPALTNTALRFGIVKDASTGSGAAFATYDATNGVVAFTGTNPDINTSTNATNNNLTADATLTAARSVSTLAINGGSSTNVGNFNLTLAGAGGLLLNTTSDYAINGGTGSLVISGGSYIYTNSNKLTVNARTTSNGFAKSGAGLLEFAGVFTNSAGALNVDKSFAVAQSATEAANDDVRISGQIAGTSALAKSGFGQLALTGSSDNSTFTGGGTLSGGTLVLAKDTEALQNTALGSGVVTFAGGALATRGVAATLANRFVIGNAAGPQSQILGDQNLTFTGIVTGAQAGNQNYFLFNNSTGVVTFAGRLQANSANNVNPTSNGLTVAGSGNTVISNGIINGGFNADGTEFANSATMVTNFVKQGSGRLEVLGTSTNTGTTRLEAGYLRLSSATALSGGSNPGASTTGSNLFIGETPSHFRQNAVLELGAGNSTFTRTLGTAVNQVQFGGNSAGFASVSGTSTVSLGVGAVPNGQIVWGSTAQFLPGNSVLTLGSPGTGGTLDFTNPLNLNNGNRTVRALNGAAVVDGVLSGVISDPGTAGTERRLTKDGAGGLSLTNANTYRGGTVVAEGILFANNPFGSATGSGAVTVNSGAALGGNGSIVTAPTVAIPNPVTTVSGSIQPGNSIGTLTVENDLLWNAGNAWVFELGMASSTLFGAMSEESTSDFLNITGGGSDFLRGTGAPGSFVFDFANTGQQGFYKLVDWTGTTTFTSADFSSVNGTGVFIVDENEGLFVQIVPEPSTYAMILGGLGALLLFRRRRVQKA